ncbi:MAG TPA: hypothetical protein VGG57_05990 [Stellaceae bacterium]
MADETEELGLKVARVTFSYGDNDKRLVAHSMRSMHDCLDAAGVREQWDQVDDTCHLNAPPASRNWRPAASCEHRVGFPPPRRVVSSSGSARCFGGSHELLRPFP